jgi:hypothetical protein
MSILGLKIHCSTLNFVFLSKSICTWNNRSYASADIDYATSYRKRKTKYYLRILTVKLQYEIEFAFSYQYFLISSKTPVYRTIYYLIVNQLAYFDSCDVGYFNGYQILLN